MRVILQRVSQASVAIQNNELSTIEEGLLILLGIEEKDTLEDIKWLSKKISHLRIFDDKKGSMNLSLLDMGGDVLIISQFTLHAKTKKGTRPSFIKAAKPEVSKPLYELFISQMEIDLNKKVKSGVFGADMKVKLTNNGPVTIIIDSKNKE